MPQVIAGAGAIYTAIGAAGAATATAAGAGAAGAAVASAAFQSAVISAIAGAAKASLTGGDMLQAALTYGAIGGVSGGLLKGAGLAIGGDTAAAGVPGVGEAAIPGATPQPSGLIGPESPDLLSQVAGRSVDDIAGAGGVNIMKEAGQEATRAGLQTVTPESVGLVGLIEQNPETARLIAGTAGGAAQGLISQQMLEDKVQAQREFEQMRINANKIQPVATLPSRRIGNFTQAPKFTQQFRGA